MHQIKLDIIKIINEIPDEKVTSFDELMDTIYIRYCALKGIEDVEAGNVMTLDELRKEVATWK